MGCTCPQIEPGWFHSLAACRATLCTYVRLVFVLSLSCFLLDIDVQQLRVQEGRCCSANCIQMLVCISRVVWLHVGTTERDRQTLSALCGVTSTRLGPFFHMLWSRQCRPIKYETCLIAGLRTSAQHRLYLSTDTRSSLGRRLGHKLSCDVRNGNQ